MESRAELKSRAERWEQASRDVIDQLASIKVDARLLKQYGYGGDPLKWTVGKIGFFAAKAVDAVEHAVHLAKESECCKRRFGNKQS